MLIGASLLICQSSVKPLEVIPAIFLHQTWNVKKKKKTNEWVVASFHIPPTSLYIGITSVHFCSLGTKKYMYMHTFLNWFRVSWYIRFIHSFTICQLFVFSFVFGVETNPEKLNMNLFLVSLPFRSLYSLISCQSSNQFLSFFVFLVYYLYKISAGRNKLINDHLSYLHTFHSTASKPRQNIMHDNTSREIYPNLSYQPCDMTSGTICFFRIENGNIKK